MLAMFVMTASFASAQAVDAVSTAKAKTCTKKCTAAEKAACAKKGIICTSKAGTVSAESDSSVLAASAAADLAASQDETIERKECATSGKVSYHQKSVCAKSGKVSKNEVKFCSKSQAFKSCSKTCSKGATSATSSTDSKVLSASAAADIAASQDETIERKECAYSGTVSYYKKSVCEKSGKVSKEQVKYCSDAQAFVNASPSNVMSDTQAKAIKTADTVDGAVQETAKAAKKKCCKGKKKCSSKKGA